MPAIKSLRMHYTRGSTNTEDCTSMVGEVVSLSVSEFSDVGRLVGRSERAKGESSLAPPSLGILDAKCRVSLLHELQSRHRMAAFDIGVLCSRARTADVNVLAGGHGS